MSTTSRAPREQREPSAVLFGQTRRRVLGWLLGHPDEAFYLRQIVRQTSGAQGAVQRELNVLTSAGIIQRTVEGRQVCFQANRESPIFPELRSLFLKPAGAGDVLREALAPLAHRIAIALIFASAARGELRSDSDIDLLVVGDAPFSRVVGHGEIVPSTERLERAFDYIRSTPTIRDVLLSGGDPLFSELPVREERKRGFGRTQRKGGFRNRPLLPERS